jgi:3-oxoadipate CoA-transferase, beta subunit
MSHSPDATSAVASAPLTPEEVAANVAADIPPGSYVNLGIGQPTLVAEHLDEAADIILHTENGMLGMGPLAPDNSEDPDLVNAGKQYVTETSGCSYFHHADSFAMIRGGHIDYCILGAFQVSTTGSLANWSTGKPDAIPAVGGAMDLAVGARNIFVMMQLFSRDGTPKLVTECTYPLTAPACVSRIYTEYATFDLKDGQVLVRNTFGITFTELRDRLGIDLALIPKP